MANLFGDDEPAPLPLRSKRPRDNAEPDGLFDDGLRWTWAMEAWSSEHGIKVECHRMDRTFRAGGKWYSLEWDTTRECWDVMPLLEGSQCC